MTQTTYEVDSLQVGLRETVKAIAEEMDIKPILMKAVKVAPRHKFTDELDKFDALETIQW